MGLIRGVRMRKIISCLVIFSFLYSNCLYGFSLESLRRETLAGNSLLQQSESVRAMTNFLSLNEITGEADVAKIINNLKNLFSRILIDEPDGLSVFYNKHFKEAFVMSKNGIVHLFIDKYTSVPEKPTYQYNVGSINIHVYPFLDGIFNTVTQLKEFIIIEGIPDSNLDPSQQADIIRKHIKNILTKKSMYDEKGTLEELVASLPEGSLRAYLQGLITLLNSLTLQSAPGSAPMSSMEHGQIGDSLVYKDGTKVYGWLYKKGIPNLESYTQDEKNPVVEARNALIIRDYIFQNEWYIEKKYLCEDLPVDIMIWNGKDGSDKNLNDICARNLQRLFSSLENGAKTELFSNLQECVFGNKIALAIVDGSHHWGENCTGDCFIGINRYLLEKIAEVENAIKAEENGQNRKGKIARLQTELEALEVFLQTCLYHELRHEAFLPERQQVHEDIMYQDMFIEQVKEMRENVDLGQINIYKLRNLMKVTYDTDLNCKNELKRKVELRQNGFDARYFAGVNRERYEEYLQYLLTCGVLSQESIFVHAAAIAGFAAETSIGSGAQKHYNELVIDDFQTGGLAKLVFMRYEKDYTKVKAQSTGKYRGSIDYLLQMIGLNCHERIEVWRKKGNVDGKYERNMAKKCIIRLIEFVSEHERYVDSVPGRGEISMFRRREKPLLFNEAAQLLTVSLLSSGDYSQAILRTELAFKTGGIVNTVTGNKHEFWKLVEEACKERVERFGDKRFEDITADRMKNASVEQEMLPRLRILYLFEKYFASIPGSIFSESYKRKLEFFCRMYRLYIKGNFKLDEFTEDQVEDFDQLYRKINKILAKVFDIEGGLWKEVFDSEEEDILIALWNAFDFVENLVPGSENYHFLQPLFSQGGAEGFTKAEIEDILQLKADFDIYPVSINPQIITSPDTARRVQTILKIYHGKIVKYRNGLVNILNRYGTSRNPNGRRVLELLRTTRGWAGALWLAREYKVLVQQGILKRAIELHAGLSVFYRALLVTGIVTENVLAGVCDLIANPQEEYFGNNPHRFHGEITSAEWTDLESGNTAQKEKEAYELVVSIHELQDVTGPDKIYRIFEEAHQLLKYGGHFAITLPPGRMFSEEALRMLKDDFGFEPIMVPGITWNELGPELRDRISKQAGGPEVAKQMTELYEKRFYVIILKKIGSLMTSGKGPTNKTALLPTVMQERKSQQIIIMPHEGIEERVDFPQDGVGPKSTRHVDFSNGELESAGYVGGETFKPQLVSDVLMNGLNESVMLKQKAEKQHIIPEYQESINNLLDETIVVSFKLRDFAKGGLNTRITKMNSLQRGDYTSQIENELIQLYIDLEDFKDFIQTNYEEYSKKLSDIKSETPLSASLFGKDRSEYQAVILFTETDLGQNTLDRVRKVYIKLQDIKTQFDSEDLRRQYADEHRDEFLALQRMFRRYSMAGKILGRGDERQIQVVLKARKEEVTPQLMKSAQDIQEKIMTKIFLGKIKVENLAKLDIKMSELFKRADCEFFFSSAEREFLLDIKDGWVQDIIPEKTLNFLREYANVVCLAGCIDAIELWDILKDEIDWTKNLALLLAGKDEMDYMDVLDNVLVYDAIAKVIGIKKRGVTIDLRMSNEDIKQALMSMAGSIAQGEDFIIGIHDALEIDSMFIEGLYNIGLDIQHIFKTHLEINKHIQDIPADIQGEVQQFIRRDKMIIIVRKCRDPVDINARLFSCKNIRREGQDLERLIAVRQAVLKSVHQDDIMLVLSEFLCKHQIKKLYSEWAKECLVKEGWVGDFFPKTDIETNVAKYKGEKERERLQAEETERRRIEKETLRQAKEEERRRQEELRQANLIKKSDIPLVSITYDDLWTESLVKELAQILLELIDDFNSPPQFDELLNNPLIAHHPQFKGISRDNLIAKIEELVRYRQYDIYIQQIYRLYGELSELLIKKDTENYKVELEDKRATFNFRVIEGRMYFFQYIAGYDPSPFAKSQEQQYRDILGNYLLFRCTDTSPLDIKDKRMFIHCLYDPEGFITQFRNTLHGLKVVTRDNLSSDHESIMRGYAKLGVKGVMFKNIKRIVERELGFITLLAGIYKNKNFKLEYLKDIEKYMDYLLNCKDFIGAPERTIEILGFLLENFMKLLEQQMTPEEYEMFKQELDKMLNINRGQAETLPMEPKKPKNSGKYLFDSYTYGDGRDAKIILYNDPVMSKLATEEVNVRYYYDSLTPLKNVRLYVLSEEEKEILKGMAEKMFLSADYKEQYEQLIAYLKVRNTVNRYLYFAFVSLTKIWAQDDLYKANERLDAILKEVLYADPQLGVYTTQAEKLDLRDILTEVYRLKQMAEDESLGDLRFELQFRIVDLIRIIRRKLESKEILEALDKITNEPDAVYKLKTALSLIGNPYHIDLIIKEIIIWLNYLSQIDQFEIGLQFFRGRDKDLKFVERRIQEFRIFSMYYPEERDIALRNIAVAIIAATPVGQACQGTAVNFLRLLQESVKDLPSVMNKIFSQIAQSDKPIMQIASMIKLIRIYRDCVLNSEPIPEDVLMLLKTNQGFRSGIIGVINDLCIGDKIDEKRVLELTHQVLSNVQTPYEIYSNMNLLCTTIRDNVAESNDQLSFSIEVLIAFLKKWVEFIKGGQCAQVTEILTKSFNQFEEMLVFVKICLDYSCEFRQYMAELFAKGTYAESAWAYYYIMSYLGSPPEYLEEGENRDVTIHEIFQRMIEAMLAKGNALDTSRFKRGLELLAFAVIQFKDIKLDQEWQVIFDAYRNVEINRDTFSAIGRNAHWLIEDAYDVNRKNVKEDVIEVKCRFGIVDEQGNDIFEKILAEEVSIEEKPNGVSDAYFCEMTDDEIDPRIRYIMEQSPDKFKFIRGISEDKGEESLRVKDEYQSLVLTAFTALIGKTKGDEFYRDLQDYHIVVVKDGGFSGHYSWKRKRIYIPIEILEALDNWSMDLKRAILEDFIEHEYLHAKGLDENKVKQISARKRPGIYEEAKKVFRSYIAQRLVDAAGVQKGSEMLKIKFENILGRIQRGEKIELTESQLQRLLWLINRSGEMDLVAKIAPLIDLIVPSGYSGDVGGVLMAVEKLILSHLYMEEQIRGQEKDSESAARAIERQIDLAETRIVHCTFNGDVRFTWNENVPKDVSPRIENTVRYVYTSLVPKPAKAEEFHYVLISTYRAERYKDIIEEISKEWNVMFITEVPKGMKKEDKEDIVVLLDPEDANKTQWDGKGFEWFLPLIYCKKSFILAAWLSINRPEKIENTPIYEFVKGFYKELLGDEIGEEEIMSWFKKPWLLQDKLQELSKSLNLLRITLRQLDQSA